VNKKHGIRRDRLYSIWQQMKTKCNNPNHRSYHLYGGKGVKVWKEWEDDVLSFYLWGKDTGYKDGMALELKDPNQDFAPWNCKWATREERYKALGEKYKDRRGTNPVGRKPVYELEIDGVEKSIKNWAEESGISYTTILHRFKRGVKGKDLIKPLDNRGKRNG
jgi:hypothetical protein